MEAVGQRFANGERTSALSRALGLSKSTILERQSEWVRTIKLAAIELLGAELSNRIKDELPSDRVLFTAMHENFIAYACSEMRHRHGLPNE